MLDPYALTKALRATAGRANLRVVFERQIMPRTDGNTIFLPAIDPILMDEGTAASMLHYAAHEVSHVEHTDFEPLRAGKMISSGTGSLLGILHNMIEDHRVDWLNGETYAGDKAACVQYMQRTSARLAKDVPARRAENEWRRLLTILRFGIECRNVPAVGADLVVMDKATEWDMMKILRKYDKRMDQVKAIRPKVAGTQATWDLACDIFRDMGGNVEEELKQQEKEKEPGTSEKAEVKKDEGSKEGEPVMTSGIIKVKWDEMSGTPGHAPEMGAAELEVDWTGIERWREQYTPAPIEAIHIVDYRRGTAPTWWGGITTYGDVDLPEGQTSETFAQSMRQRLQIYARTRYEYGQKTGRLNTRALYKVGIKEPGVCERVFKKPAPKLDLDAAVSVVVDCSGSMRRAGKFNHAAKGLILLNDALGNVMHIPTECIGFTDYTAEFPGEFGAGVHSIYRDFGTTFLGTEELLGYLQDTTHHMRDNADGDAILWCYHRLMQRKEKRKVMIVLSDGMPATRRPGNSAVFLKNVCKGIQAAGVVDLYGIGIMTNSVKEFYPQHVTIADAGELEIALLNTINQAIMKGYK